MSRWVMFCSFLLPLLLCTGCETDLFPTEPAAVSAGDFVNESSSIGSKTAPMLFEQNPYIGNSRHGHPMNHFLNQQYIDRDAGGVLNFFGGNLSIPADSIDSSKVVWARIFAMRGHFHHPPPPPDEKPIFRNIYDFGPSGTTFDVPATLTVNYRCMPPIDGDTLVLTYYNEDTQRWEIVSTMTHDPANKSFSGYINHFSRYSLSANGQVLQQAQGN